MHFIPPPPPIPSLLQLGTKEYVFFTSVDDQAGTIISSIHVNYVCVEGRAA